MKKHFLVILLLAVGLLAPAQPQNHKKETMNNNKKDVAIWYDAFNRKDPALVDKILDANWVDIPSAPNQKPGLQGMKDLLADLTTTFPDFNVRIEEILQDGNKVRYRDAMFLCLEAHRQFVTEVANHRFTHARHTHMFA